MPLLYYWRPDNYRHDLDMGTGYHLNQDSPLMHKIDLGDSLWAFTRSHEGRYVLAAELVVRAKTLNAPGFRYGRFRIWGELKRSRYFVVDGAPSVGEVIRNLSCRAHADSLGQSFQGRAAVRAINEQDHLLLTAAASDLPLEPRARILPEERLEAALLLGNEEAVRLLVRQEKSGIVEKRLAYLFGTLPSRNAALALHLQRLYEGRCQVCQWDPVKKYGEYLCHAHHLQWLSRGGEDALENMALICPNHHGAVHRCDAPLDYADLTFVFSQRRMKIMLNTHIPIVTR